MPELPRSDMVAGRPRPAGRAVPHVGKRAKMAVIEYGCGSRLDGLGSVEGAAVNI